MIDTIKERCAALIENLGRVLQTADLNRIFFHVPLWKHYYHTLYWFDYHFAGQDQYIGAPFHASGLDDIDLLPEVTITKEQLQDYYIVVAKKSLRFLESLTEEMLLETTGGEHNRLSIIFGQMRHVYSHLGNINAITIEDTGRWPRMEIWAGENSPLYE